MKQLRRKVVAAFFFTTTIVIANDYYSTEKNIMMELDIIINLLSYSN